MSVVDASVIIELLLGTNAAAAIEARIFAPGVNLNAPHLLDVEVAHVLRRHAMRGEIDDARGRNALTDLADLPITRYSHGWLVSTAWRLRHNVSAYDAMYVALAEALSEPLLTYDGKLAAAAGSIVAVERM